MQADFLKSPQRVEDGVGVLLRNADINSLEIEVLATPGLPQWPQPTQEPGSRVTCKHGKDESRKQRLNQSSYNSEEVQGWCGRQRGLPGKENGLAREGWVLLRAGSSVGPGTPSPVHGEQPGEGTFPMNG